MTGARGNIRVLVVDGNQTTRRLLCFLLADEGYTAVPADSVEAGRRAIQDSSAAVHLVLLDRETSGPDWRAILRELQRQSRFIPLILLSSEAAVEARVRELEGGADDFIKKPFDPSELLARVESILRRIPAETAEEPVLRSGGLQLDSSRLRVRDSAGKEAQLTPTEARLLAFLMRNVDRVLPREALVSHVWGKEAEGNNLDVYILRIRKKVERDPSRPEHIRTVTGVGYVFRTG